MFYIYLCVILCFIYVLFWLNLFLKGCFLKVYFCHTFSKSVLSNCTFRVKRFTYQIINTHR